MDHSISFLPDQLLVVEVVKWYGVVRFAFIVFLSPYGTSKLLWSAIHSKTTMICAQVLRKLLSTIHTVLARHFSIVTYLHHLYGENTHFTRLSLQSFTLYGRLWRFCHIFTWNTITASLFNYWETAPIFFVIHTLQKCHILSALYVCEQVQLFNFSDVFRSIEIMHCTEFRGDKITKPLPKHNNQSRFQRWYPYFHCSRC